MPSPSKHRVVIVGAATAGLSTAVRLKHTGVDDIAILDPGAIHDYQIATRPKRSQRSGSNVNRTMPANQ